MAEEQQPHKRLLPQSELDLAMLTTDSVWGKTEINPQLQERLKEFFIGQNEEGKQEVITENNWASLGFFTRDMRLANLNDLEVLFCNHYIDLANDFLQVNMNKPFIVCMARNARVLELSQSKKGFLRKNLNTIRQEHINQDLEPPKKNLFGMGSKKEGI
jgi:hypothetical protein